MDSVYIVTIMFRLFFLAINVAFTDQIRGPSLRTDHSNTSIHNLIYLIRA